MGISNELIFPFSLNFFKKCINDYSLNLNKNVALIGEQNIYSTEINKFIYNLNKNISFFDIAINDKTDEEIKYFNFDINNEWRQIKNFNIVTIFRVTCYINNKDMFFSNLKKCINNNKNIFIDFTFMMRDTTYPINFDLRKIFSKEKLDNLNSKIYNYKDKYNYNTIFWSDFENYNIIPDSFDILFNTTKNDFIVLMYFKGNDK